MKDRPIFWVSERKLNDSEIRKLVHEAKGEALPVMVYKFSYTPPYEKDAGFIRKFQYRSAYKPFSDDTQKKKTAVINMTEWLDYEKEERLEIFTKFLHDYHAFFDFEYVFLVENTNKHETRDLYKRVSECFGRGQIRENGNRDDKEAI